MIKSYLPSSSRCLHTIIFRLSSPLICFKVLPLQLICSAQSKPKNILHAEKVTFLSLSAGKVTPIMPLYEDLGRLIYVTQKYLLSAVYFTYKLMKYIILYMFVSTNLPFQFIHIYSTLQ